MSEKRYGESYAKSRALLVGINAYKHVNPLRFAVSDAEGVARRLIDRCGFAADDVVILLDDKATRANILQEVYSLADQAEPEDRVVLFFAGHGSYRNGNRGRFGFFVPVEAQTGSWSTMVSWSELIKAAVELNPAKHLLFIADACFSGNIAKRSLRPGTRRLVRDMMTRHARQYMASGKGDQQVDDEGGPLAGHSIFTGHLLNAIDQDSVVDNGVLSTDSLMGHVRARVGSQYGSIQTPTCGCWHDDGGDLYLIAPRINPESKEGDATMTTIPFGVGIQDGDDATPILRTETSIDTLKRHIADPSAKIKLSDFVFEQLREVQRKLSNEQFSTQSAYDNAEFAQRLVAYDQAMHELLPTAVILGRWITPPQHYVIRDIVNALAGQIEMRGGSTVLLGMRLYPMLLFTYAAGIAAVEGENYEALGPLFETPVINERYGRASPVVEFVFEQLHSGQFTTCLAELPDLAHKYTPMSEYLFARMQPTLEDHLRLGRRYEAVFDRFELFLALCSAHCAPNASHRLGRFAWKHRASRGDTDSISVFGKEAAAGGAHWKPVKAGLFGGNPEQVATLSNSLLETVKTRSRSW